jgi:hypothetical protein
MIIQNENPLSSLVEGIKTKHLKIEYSPIYKDKWHYKGGI